MKLHLPRNDSIGQGLVVLAAGLTRDAGRQLDGLAAAPVETVHRARVALKRARSALRLLEKAGAPWAIMPRYRLTQAGGLMSAARENAAAAGLARKFSCRLRGREREVVLRLAARPGPLAPPEAGQIRQDLLAEARGLATAPAPAITPAKLRHLLRRSLGRAARRYRVAVEAPAPESVHEWRKAAIVLRDQCAFAAARCPQGAGAAHLLLVRFARQLGRCGDLWLLGRRLRRLRVPAAQLASRRRLLARVEMQRRLGALAALLRWLRLERRLARLLAEKTGPRGKARPGR